jgi:hypothetical protein
MSGVRVPHRPPFFVPAAMSVGDFFGFFGALKREFFGVVPKKVGQPRPAVRRRRSLTPAARSTSVPPSAPRPPREFFGVVPKKVPPPARAEAKKLGPPRWRWQNISIWKSPRKFVRIRLQRQRTSGTKIKHTRRSPAPVSAESSGRKMRRAIACKCKFVPIAFCGSLTEFRTSHLERRTPHA